MIRLPSIAVFQYPAYRNFWLSRVGGTLAMQMQLAAMLWQIYDAGRIKGWSIEESAFLLGGLGLAQFLPLLCLSLIGGQTADRHNRLAIIQICFSLKAVIALTLVFTATAPPDLMIAVMFGIALINGAVNAFLPAAFSALIPMLVPREHLPQAIAWNSISFQTGIIAGPSLGGALLLFGPSVPYMISLGLYALSITALAIVAMPKHEPVKEARSVGMIVEGLRFVWSNKVVLGAISLDLIVVLLAGAVALLPVFARDLLHAGPEEMGVLRSSMGVGAVLVAFWLAAKPLHRHVGMWMFGSTVVFGIATIVFGLSRSFWLTAGALAVAGGADMISVYVRQSLIQLATPDAMRGRVGAVSFVFISASNELGDFEAGLTARLLGPTLAVTVGGAAAIAASLGWMKLFPQLTAADGFETTDSTPTETAAETAAAVEGKTA